MTHEAYEREPVGVIEWMLRIEAVYEKVRRRAEQRAAQTPGGR